MGTTIAAVKASQRRAERDRLDPVGAIARNRLRAIMSLSMLSLWGGGALIVAVAVAPAAFRVLPTRALAGALVGQVLPVVFIAGLVIGTLAFVLTAGGAPRALLRRIGAGGIVLGCAAAQGVIAPKIAALREQIGPNIEALATTDPLRVAFGRLHGFSVMWLGVAMVACLIAMAGTALAAQTVASTDPD